MALPSRYRTLLSETLDLDDGDSIQLVLVPDLESACLSIYPLNQWQLILKKIDGLANTSGNKQFKRWLLGNAEVVEADRNGRILIPPRLREIAKLERALALVGQSTKFEVWDDQRWKAANGELPDMSQVSGIEEIPL
ncbi:cell division/cell wall cluster transcriptional repressor MraZ [Pelagibaculum spongiae]|uniref:Transcriptional regulator MraZ n=2 Tax=Pelagibaculum spongiae TaxID=2080658 RepID=A0A2V1H1Q1_9GAMM|nr:cell division/cell wall cluster transcriptional repressor MraZ [Pelagibaculum spongiae]